MRSVLCCNESDDPLRFFFCMKDASKKGGCSFTMKKKERGKPCGTKKKAYSSHTQKESGRIFRLDPCGAAVAEESARYGRSGKRRSAAKNRCLWPRNVSLRACFYQERATSKGSHMDGTPEHHWIEPVFGR